MTLYGTSYFEDTIAATNHYRGYGYEDVLKAVDQKRRDGEIHIGRPPVPVGCKLTVMAGRYFIEVPK